MRKMMIRSAEDIEKLVQYYGFLPFFRNSIPGFSVEEHTPAECWFVDGVEGPWEWKGPAARSGRCVYGKFYGGRAGFVSLEMFPDFLNYRRDGYDFDARYDEGLARNDDKYVYDTVVQRGSALTGELKKICGFRKGGRKGFDGIITRLQMKTYLIISDFVYHIDKKGIPSGWGTACYTTPEKKFGADFTLRAYKNEPQKSKKKMLEFLAGRLPSAPAKEISNVIA
ncbi:MAG: hypothetical protein ACI4NN_05785 [Pyramidobacter sp.]